ncbi:MAG: PIG-L deacetylase family protein [Clostridia bacterium]
MGLFSLLLKKIIPIPKFKDCESFAFIGPHPDDIEVGCGATVSRLVREGKRVCFIVATDGRYGGYDLSRTTDELVAMRREESIAAAKLLGVEDVRFMGFPDGGDYSIIDMRNKIAVELANFKADMVVVPDNHLKSELHIDHINAGRAGEIAFMTAGNKLMMHELGCDSVAEHKGIAYYYTDKPNTYFKIKKSDYDAKISSLRAHKSQFGGSEDVEKIFGFMQLYFKLSAIKNGLKRFGKYAEAYRVLAPVHTHCAPEAADF